MLMLIDKGYYDYDFELTQKLVTVEDTIKSEEELSSLTSRFGFGRKAPKDMDAEDLQSYAMKENNND